MNVEQRVEREDEEDDELGCRIQFRTRNTRQGWEGPSSLGVRRVTVDAYILLLLFSYSALLIPPSLLPSIQTWQSLV